MTTLKLIKDKGIKLAVIVGFSHSQHFDGIALLDEGVDVWRPVQAAHLHDNVYRVLDKPSGLDDEIWQFEPGDEVLCEMIESSDGRILAATRKVAQR